ncbi:Signal recognition particle protein [Tetrabaena socialis]|uniref:Signal recognition particle 14 kDa protein n=1 Tax=Tetrabaena socialis TaxID=47790 RepID=A0A2J8AIR4_9CHLO|nr:Signal recognition particle protein [Tetrabaena socialis]|eukprot:PNH12407.1 Signal recognition particle protein [Tetrabaena socialis]
MVLLEPDPFLSELHKMYDRNKAGTVWVTMKRSNMKPRKSKKPETAKAEYVCLIRANDGKRHVSTTVSPTQYAKFSQSMVIIMKGAMADTLKKKEKKRDK